MEQQVVSIFLACILQLLHLYLRNFIQSEIKKNLVFYQWSLKFFKRYFFIWTEHKI